MSGVISPGAYGYNQGFNPGQAIGWMGGIQNLLTSRYELQQAQLQPVKAALNAALENPNLSYDDLNAAVANGVRLGGNPAGMSAAIQEMATRGYSPRDIAIQLGTAQYAPAFESAEMFRPDLAARAYGQGVHQGLLYGPYSAHPGQFVPLDGSGGGAGGGPMPSGGGGAGAPVAPPSPGTGEGAGGSAPVPSDSDSGTPLGPGRQAAGIPGLPGSPSGPAVGPHGPMGTPAQMRAQMAVNAETGQPLFSGFYGSLSAAESNNRNILSTVDPGSPAERSQGYFQINTPTAMQFAARAGIDPRLVANGVMNLNPAEQQALVSQIPFGRFGGRTQRMLEAQYGPINPNMTIGQLAARFDQGGGGGGGAGAPFQVASAGNTFPVPTGAGGAGANEPATGSPYFTPFGRAEGAAEATRTVFAQGAASQQAFADDVADSPGRVFTAQQALTSLKGAWTGPGTAVPSAIAGFLGTFEPAALKRWLGSDYDPKTIATNRDLAEKYLTQVAMGQAGVLGQGTNEKLATAIAGSPNTHIQNLAAQDVLRVMVGMERMKQMMYSDMQSANGGQGVSPDQFRTWRANWMTSHDPRAFILDQMPVDQKQRLRADLYAPGHERERAVFATTLRQAQAGGYE